MSDIEKNTNGTLLYDELEDDLRHLINKYGRIMGGGARSEHGGVPPIDS